MDLYFNVRHCTKEHFEAVNGDLRAQLDNAKVTTFTVRSGASNGNMTLLSGNMLGDTWPSMWQSDHIEWCRVRRTDHIDAWMMPGLPLRPTPTLPSLPPAPALRLTICP